MAEYSIDVSKKKGQINRNIYGHFSEHLGRCIYGGLYVGEDSNIPNKNGMRTDVVEALKAIKAPVLRWPGGCFADEYHWKDGVGPKATRKKMVNTNWGGVVEDNSFGTHEFMELCSQIGCEPYICGNVGSGTVQEMAEWVEYVNFEGLSPMSQWRSDNGHEQAWNLKYFGVGNESWGCGGNMRPDFYADNYRRYQTYARNYNGKNLYRIACGSNTDDYQWTEVLMKNAANLMDGLSLHYYAVPGPWEHKGSATVFDDAEYYLTLKKALYMEELVCKHSAIMDKYDPDKKVAMIVDEWGTWLDVEPGTNPGFLYQQNTIRDALVASATLNIFNKHCDRVKMANIAQTVNVLQAVILTDGADMLLTPTYHTFKLYNVHHDAELVHSVIRATWTGTDENLIPNLSESASVDQNGVLNITLCNLDLNNDQTINATIAGGSYTKITGEILVEDVHAANTFEEPNKVAITAFDGCQLTAAGFDAVIPAHSVVKLSLS